MPTSATEKPRVRPTSADTFAVSYRGQSGTITRVDHYDWRSELGGETFGSCRSEYALSSLVRAMNKRADCAEWLAKADALDCWPSVADKTLGIASHADAVYDAFQEARALLSAHDPKGIPTVQGVLDFAAKKRAPKRVSTIVTMKIGETTYSYAVHIVPGLSVSIIEGPTYIIGGRAEYDSFNLSYLGRITKITTNTVTIRKSDGTSRRLKIGEFAYRNAKPVARKLASNAEELQHL